ncbi:MAG: SoxR reducing system RseC family protein, partial [Candidatus Marinimicrobia bacterium]|nr:SoxR reducing system RseC family protein [Candidatus Neomarinimicrobiota bacterium]
ARPGIGIGDKVSVEQEGNILTKTTLLAYGLPLLFFIAGFFLAGLLPVGRVPQELIRFLCACAGLIAGGALGRIAAGRLSQKLQHYIRIKPNKI